MALRCWKLQKFLPELFYWNPAPEHGVSRTEREEREHILCLQLIWSYGLLASAFQTDFSKWKYFIIFLWRKSQTFWKRFCSTVDWQKQKNRNPKICHGGSDFKNLLHVILMSKIRVLIHNLKYFFHIYVCMHTETYMYFFGEAPDCVPTMWGMMARRKSACGDTSFLVTEQPQPVTKCCFWLALPASATGFSVTLHTKVLLQFASYFPRL